MENSGIYNLLSQLMAPNAKNPLQALLMPQYRDQPSATDQALAYKKMLQQRSNAQIQTIDPGTTWGGLDKNAVQPSDATSALFYGRGPENI